MDVAGGYGATDGAQRTHHQPRGERRNASNRPYDTHENPTISRTSTAQPAPDAVTGIWPNPRPITKAETGGFGDQAPLAGATPPLKREVSQQRHCSFMIETYASHYGMFFENAVKFAN